MLSQSTSLRFNRESALSSIAETIDDGFYVADFFSNDRIQPPVYHYIITRRGSTEILDWGQGFSMDAIRNQALGWLAHRVDKIA